MQDNLVAIKIKLLLNLVEIPNKYNKIAKCRITKNRDFPNFHQNIKRSTFFFSVFIRWHTFRSFDKIVIQQSDIIRILIVDFRRGFDATPTGIKYHNRWSE